MTIPPENSSVPAICYALIFDKMLRNISIQDKEYIPRKKFKDKEAAIVFLASSERLPELVNSLRSIFEKFNDEFHYPILLFHFGDLDLIQTIECFKAAKFDKNQLSLIEFVKAEGGTEFPPDVGPDQEWADFVRVPDVLRYPNYHHMCTFWTRTIYHQLYFRKK